MTDTGARHPKALILIHWLTVVAVLVAYFSSEGGPRLREHPPTLHFVAGLAVLLLLVPRVLVRLMSRPLPPVAGSTPAAERVAKAGHGVLYLVLLALPFTGWYAASRMGVPVAWGGLALPSMAVAVQGPPGPVAELHELGGNALLVIAGLHALAALWHHFRLRDGTLRRMSPH